MRERQCRVGHEDYRPYLTVMDTIIDRPFIRIALHRLAGLVGSLAVNSQCGIPAFSELITLFMVPL